MARHNQLGKQGEEMANAYLKGKGYAILFRNWRYSHYEIDIIAIKDDLLHIVEVKLLYSNQVGFPEAAVTRKKFRRLLKAADEFLFQHQQYTDVQYDILSIRLFNGLETEYFLIEDVFL